MASDKNKLSHVDGDGTAKMVNVSEKDETLRQAKATGTVILDEATMELVKNANLPKGDVLSVARIAGIQAAKSTSNLIPLCHSLPLSHVDIDFKLLKDNIEITATCRTIGRTGVEMEALTAVSITCLTIYDMVKAVARHGRIHNICLLEKSGGKSGNWQA